MFDKEFLKTLTVMYVEDDESIRSSLSGIFKKIFGEVIICNDGNDGVNQFKYYTQERGTHIDAIVSDINMPNLNGIDMIKEIRQLDEEIPVIFTTAHGESNYLMEAIKLKIAYYALKPINTTELLQNISKFCMIEHNKSLVLKKEQEITQYMDIMNNIASMFKIDENGKIIEANELFSEISEYSKEVLLTMDINSLLHNDALITNYNDILKLLGDNDSSTSKIKFISKSGNIFYLNTTIITSLNSSTGKVTGYILIGLDQTNTELEKQQTMQRVRKNIVEQRSKESNLAKQIKILEDEIMILNQNATNNRDTDFIISALNKEKQKVLSLNSQITHYEKEVTNLTRQKNQIVTDEKTKKAEIMHKNQELSKENNSLQTKVIELQAFITQLQEKQRGTTVG
ncbi:MAG: response regulator [Campylobacterota bacterium]|nr:response regulator [Campylobacterota bacterium]